MGATQLYIVRNNRARASLLTSLAAQRLTRDARISQIRELLRVRDASEAEKTFQSWIVDAGAKLMRLLQTDVGTLLSQFETGAANKAPFGSVTGMSLVRMSEEDADRMRKELPGVAVVRDRPLSLIRPNRPTGGKQARVARADIWHQEATWWSAAKRTGMAATGQGVTIAVLDTGVDETHPEIQGKVSAGYRFDVAKGEVVRMTPSTDTEGHGTHVAGLICGNTVGHAPGARVLNGTMIPNGEGNLSDFAFALEWTALRPEVQIMNMSAGIPGFIPELRSAMEELVAVGVLPVIAVGNEGRHRTRSPGNFLEALSVGATNKEGRVASFSGSGTMIVDNSEYNVPDLVAPGEGVLSCVVGGGYEPWDGTSMATPIVSGIAALIIEKYPNITVTDLSDELVANCAKLERSPEWRQGHGLVQVPKKLARGHARKKSTTGKKKAAGKRPKRGQ
ncbi:MAG: S8 family serine peptidase [Candidatus Omnitrophica bacterium]|nr:hypothetical protein [bacterium]NUN95489.1 S8 family serine peptidase [Candidatus Omnitrophota bacterium]